MAEPYCLAMVLCDNVHRDATTGKCTLLGTFSVFHPRKFPAKVRFCVYAEITDGLGETKIGLQIVESRALLDDSGEEPFAWHSPEEASPTIAFKDPLVVMQMTFMCELELPKAGQYHCELLANGTLLMARRMIVIGPPAKADNPDEGE